ncbi:MAG: hypothetical protein Kow0069_01210 [Promethearchaeota archaeon]
MTGAGNEDSVNTPSAFPRLWEARLSVLALLRNGGVPLSGDALRRSHHAVLSLLFLQFLLDRGLAKIESTGGKVAHSLEGALPPGEREPRRHHAFRVVAPPVVERVLGVLAVERCVGRLVANILDGPNWAAERLFGGLREVQPRSSPGFVALIQADCENVVGVVRDPSSIPWDDFPGGLERVAGQLASKRGDKRKGAFYTPRFVARYLATKALLLATLQRCHGDPTPEVERPEAEVRQLLKQKWQFLRDVTVLDPAAGSGRLLSVTAEVLFDALSSGREQGGGKSDAFSTALEVLRSLHGVDVEDVAVWTTRFSLYAWLFGHAGKIEGVDPSLVPDLRAQVKRGNSLLGARSREQIPLARLTGDGDSAVGPFDWPLEFPGAFPPGSNGGFNVIVANPPYGDLLTAEEKSALKAQGSKVSANQVASCFLEAELDLLKRGGALANVLSGSVAANKSSWRVRHLLRERCSHAHVAYFGTRPTKLFRGLEIRPCVVLAVKDDSPQLGRVYSTASIKLREEDRELAFEGLRFARADDLLLGEHLGAPSSRSHYFPRVGTEKTRRVLKVLAKLPLTLKDYIVHPPPSNPDGAPRSWRHKTVGYWIVALTDASFLNNEREWAVFHHPSELARDFFFLVLNSHLFYAYWTTYSDLFHLNESLVRAFPAPSHEVVEGAGTELHQLARRLQEQLKTCYRPNKGRNGEFEVRRCLSVLDESEVLLGKLFDLDERLIAHVTNLDAFIRGRS